MLVYYPHVYICNYDTHENVFDIGQSIVMFQEYSGGTTSNISLSTFTQTLQDNLENYSMLTSFFLMPDSNTTDLLVKFPFIPVISSLVFPDEYFWTRPYSYKVVFPDTGDYLIGRSYEATSWNAYNANGELITRSSLDIWLFGIGHGTKSGSFPYVSSRFNMVRTGGIDTNNNTFKSSASFYYAESDSSGSVHSISELPNYAKEPTILFFNRQTANQPPQPPDPYEGAGDSTTGGGGGNFDGSSDPIDMPSLPSVGATNTGFISLFVPSESQVRSVANYLWSSLFDVSTFFKIFENPMDCILGLSVVPVTVPTSGSAQITVGNIELSGITLPLASAQYVEVDCGTISFEDKFFGSYLDYEPYTKMAIFLPYCGVHQINADDIMGKVIRVVYHVDILTGSCVAFVKCGDSVLYQFNGACATNIPITNISYNSTIENAIRIAVNIGTTVATAGASAPLSVGAETVGHTAQNIARGVSLAGSTAEGALSLKPSIGRSGALGGTTGILAGQKPYLIITRPRLCKPKNQDYYKGYPSFVQTTVGDLIGKGYTEFDTIIISTLYLTDNEEAELERIMQGGVYL